jgi:hypothetical protein
MLCNVVLYMVRESSLFKAYQLCSFLMEKLIYLRVLVALQAATSVC